MAMEYKAGRRRKDSQDPLLIRKQIYMPIPDVMEIKELARVTGLPQAEHIRRAVSIYLDGQKRNRAGDEAGTIVSQRFDPEPAAISFPKVLGGALPANATFK